MVAYHQGGRHQRRNDAYVLVSFRVAGAGSAVRPLGLVSLGHEERNPMAWKVALAAGGRIRSAAD